MRILFDHSFPFSLTHGGFQTQIEQTKLALEGIGVEVEHMRWWDDKQRGDIIHYFGRPPGPYIEAAHGRGMKVVIAELLTGTGSRSRRALKFQKLMIEASRALLPDGFTARLAWDAYRRADAVVALTPWEAKLMQYLFHAPADRIHVVPNGVESEFFAAPPTKRGEWLVCTATITERKRVVELAEAAVQARTPLWIIGRAYAENDPYSVRFEEVIRTGGSILRYEGPIQDRTRLATIYREARGVVLLSSMESQSLSALEAAACECPLLLSDLPWARTTFDLDARYCPVPAPVSVTAQHLRTFYENAEQITAPKKPATWKQVAEQIRSIYALLLRTSP